MGDASPITIRARFLVGQTSVYAACSRSYRRDGYPMDATTVLLVEDDTDNRTVLVTLLEHFGYRVVPCSDGESALDLARQEHPDAVLMDLSLPGMDGYTAAARLRAHPHTAGMPVIALSGDASGGAQERARAAGCTAFLVKPCRPSELVEALRAAIGTP